MKDVGFACRVIPNYLRLISMALLFFLFSKATAQTDADFTWSVDHNLCDGYIDIRYKIHYESGTDDFLKSLRLYYKDNSGTDNQFYYVSRPSGGETVTFTIQGPEGSGIDGRNYYESKGASHLERSILYNAITKIVTVQLRWYSPPDFFYGGNVTFLAKGTWSKNNSDVTIDKSLMFGIQSVPTPASPMASTDECDGVTISWTNPSTGTGFGEIPGTCFSTTEKWYIEVTRIDENNIEQSLTTKRIDNGSTFTENTYNDVSNLALGEDYRYKINFKLSSDFTDGSSFTVDVKGLEVTTTAGHIADNLPAPTALPTTDPPTCDGTVNIKWKWLTDLPNEEFLIVRSSDNAYFKVYPSTSPAVETYKPDNTAAPAESASIAYDDASKTWILTDKYSPSQNADITYKVAALDCDEDASSGRTRSSYNYLEVIGRTNTAPSGAPDITSAQQATLDGKKIAAIDITWKTSSFVESYDIERNGTSLVTGLTTTSYRDESVSICQSYSYKIIAVNGCGSLSGAVKPDILVGQDLPDFGTVEASKGYFTGVVEVRWSISNASAYTNFRIQRKPLIGNAAWDPIDIVANNERLYRDERAEAGVLYQYRIQGVANCGGIEDTRESSADVGFRQPVATVSGAITYQGGNPVEGVDVLVEKAAENTGHSLIIYPNFDYTGSESTVIEVPDDNVPDDNLSNPLDPGAELTIEMYVKANSIYNDATLANKADDNNQTGYKFFYDVSRQTLVFRVYTNNASNPYFEVTNSYFRDPQVFGKYTQVTASYSSSKKKIKLTINGDSTVVVNTGSGTIKDNTLSLLFGNDLKRDGNDYLADINGVFSGNIDEIRLWKRWKTDEEIKYDHNRILSGKEDGLIGYWQLDEGAGVYAYDLSRRSSTEFNKNNGIIRNFYYGASWSDDVPGGTQLAFKGKTGPAGNYIVNNVRYSGNGNNFTITPIFFPHEFRPSQRAVFLGEGSNSITGQDFEDISSFEVSGYMFFADPESPFLDDAVAPFEKADVKGCPANDVNIKIDGTLATDANGLPIVTGGDGLLTGEFLIEVPIGKHTITFEKNGHAFASFNGDGQLIRAVYTKTFLEPVSDLVFLDTTRITVAGRIVGGLKQGKKNLAETSINNIGRGSFVIDNNGCTVFSQVKIGYDGDLGAYNEQTGNYLVKLPPISFTVQPPSVERDIYAPINYPPQDGLDLTGYNPIKVDSAFDDNGNLDTVVFYNVRRDFIYRAPVEIDVTNADGSPFTGEDELLSEGGTSFDLRNPQLLDYEVFMQDSLYKTKISLFESYSNPYITANEEQVPVTDALVKISNGFGQGNPQLDPDGDGIDEIATDNSFTGELSYDFYGRDPNVQKNEATPDQSFTKSFSVDADITLENGEVVTAKWPASGSYLGYVLGSKLADGTSFVTQGPSVVDYILRDPPGSNSSAYFSKEKTYTKKESLTTAEVLGTDFTINAKLGSKNFVAPGPFGGPLITTEVINDIQNTISVETKLSQNSEWVESTTFKDNVSTSSSPELVGAPSDIFVAKSSNFLLGRADVVQVVKDEFCDRTGSGEGYACIASTFTDPNGVKYSLGVKPVLSIQPDEIKTTFYFTQNQIETDRIPKLVQLRNALLLNETNNYQCNTCVGQEGFGLNNDDKFWTNPSTNPDDGPSYTYTRPANIDDKEIVLDSVRWYNQQIRLWEEALKLNEEEKANAESKKNISLDAGSSYDFSFSSTNSYSFTSNFELALSNDFVKRSGGIFLGAGVTTNLTIKVGLSTNTSEGVTNSKTNSYGYILSDGDNGDIFTIDVMDGKNGNGPIFKLLGGETMCPWEGPVMSKYLDQPTVLSNGTFRREVPIIDVIDPIVNDVPIAKPATFELRLGNGSESDDTQWYGLRAIDSRGAKLTIDGIAINNGSVFEVPAGQYITKQLKVSPQVDGQFDYDNIRLLFYSTCEWSERQNGGTLQNADTLTISAFFVPSCISVDVERPSDKWIINSKNENQKLPINLINYDKDFDELENIQIQYRSANTATWNVMEAFWKNEELAADDPDPAFIPEDQDFIAYNWDVSNLTDGSYEIRAFTNCTQNQFDADILSGKIDRIKPRAFGAPQPADGILDANDDIIIEFNEPIDETKINALNFDIRAVLNGSDIQHQTSVLFDGTNDNVEIPQGIQLSRGSFTIEMWVNRRALGEMTLLSQGTSQDFWRLGFGAGDHLVFENNTTKATSKATIIDSDPDGQVPGSWYHIAVSYNADEKQIYFTINGADPEVYDFNFKLNEAPKIYVAEDVAKEKDNFKGNIHELRIWNRVVSRSDINANMLKMLSGTNRGIVGLWPLSEGEGTLAIDKVRDRNATINAEWEIAPSGYALQLNGTSDHFDIVGGSLTMLQDQDFSIELWFKGNKANNATLFSTGKGDGTDGNDNGWNVGTDGTGKLVIDHNGKSHIITAKNYMDDDWHHFAMAVNRASNTNIYIDGALINSFDGELFIGFGGSEVHVGCRGWRNPDSTEDNDRFFSGSIDEFRIWNAVLNQEQFNRNKNFRLQGDEFGLRAYFPFENYKLAYNELTLDASLEDNIVEDITRSKNEASLEGGELVDSSPNIKIQRPMQGIRFDYVLNDDRIVLTPLPPNGDLSLIENTTLDIAVRGLWDLNGNEMGSAVKWSAYVNKNQVKWKDPAINLAKQINEPLSFETTIVNKGGTQQGFTIENMPAWLSASTTSGIIDPLSEIKVNFKVADGVNIGDYDTDLVVRTDEGFSDRLTLNLKVAMDPPDWSVNSQDFQHSMNIVGQLSIEGNLSTDDEDILAAFVGDEVRGVGHMQLVPDFDRYLVFLDVYSNQNQQDDPENVTFKIWDASQGIVYGGVTPEFKFEDTKGHGTPTEPVTFETTGQVYQSLPLSAGWNWISFNVEADNFDSLNMALSSLSPSQLDVIKSVEGFDLYEGLWAGGVTNSGGINVGHMYKIKTQMADTLIVLGTPIIPSASKISIPMEASDNEQVWSWLPYYPSFNLDVNEAMATFNAQDGDVLKSQYNFAIFDNTLGWIGTLEFMQPGRGYMLQSDATGTLVYPDRSKLSSNGRERKADEDARLAHYENTMNIIAAWDIDDPEIAQKNIGIFVNNQFRGKAEPVPVGNEKRYFLSIPAEGAGLGTFKVLDDEGEPEYNISEDVEFEVNGVLGSLDQPFLLSLEDPNNILYVYPNPFSKNLSIDYYAEQEEKVTIVVSSISGATLYEKNIAMNSGPNTIQIDNIEAFSGQGTYLIKVKTSKKTIVKRIIKL